MDITNNLKEFIPQDDWCYQLKDRTIESIRPGYLQGSSTPQLRLRFTDGTTWSIVPKDGVFFECGAINLLRKAAPVTYVGVRRKREKHYVEVWAGTFPLFLVTGVCKDIPDHEFPFELWTTEAFA